MQMVAVDAGSPLDVNGLNSSFNNGSLFGSGLDVHVVSPFPLHFCTLAGNFPSNAVVFGCEGGLPNISCFRIVNNTCRSQHQYPGLICVTVPVWLTFFDCVIQRNSIDFLLGGRGVAMFDRCVFDQLALAQTGAITYQSANCSVITWSTELPNCLLRLPSPTPGPGTVDPADSSPGLSVGGIVGVALSCVVIVGLSGFAIVVCVRRRRRGVAYLEEMALSSGSDATSFDGDLRHIGYIPT